MLAAVAAAAVAVAAAVIAYSRRESQAGAGVMMWRYTQSSQHGRAQAPGTPIVGVGFFLKANGVTLTYHLVTVYNYYL